MFKVGMSSCGFSYDETSFEQLKNSGIEAFEMKAPCPEDFKKAKDLSEKFSIDIWSCHLPFYPFEQFDISNTDSELRKNTLKTHEDIIMSATDMGVDKFVVHPSGEPVFDDVRSEHLKCAEDSLDKLAEFAYHCGACIAVEDLPRTCLGHDSEEILCLTSVNNKLRICLDTNHLLTEDIFSFMDKFGDKIITVHISDYDFIDEKHWLPGEGDLNWIQFYNKLCEINYKGVWMYEVTPSRHPGIEREHNLTFKDVFQNAQTIFSGTAPKPFGKRIITTHPMRVVVCFEYYALSTV